MTIPVGHEYFKLYDPNANTEIVMGCRAVTIENIDDFMTGPSVRGSDTPNVWQRGSSAGTRVAGSAEYNMSIVINGFYDLYDNTADSLSLSVMQTLRKNISDIKKFAITPVSYREQNLLNLKWFGNCAAPVDPFLLAYVHLLPSIQVTMLSTTSARMVLTFVNPNGYWMGEENMAFADCAIGTEVFATKTVTNNGNIPSNEVYFMAIGPSSYLKIQRDSGGSFDELVIPEEAVNYDLIEIDVKKQVSNYYEFAVPYVPNGLSGKIVAKSQTWLSLLPGVNTLNITRTKTDINTPVVIVSRSTYV